MTATDRCPRCRSARAASCAALALAIARGLAAPASAALYKWTDANGRVVYSDQPPPGNVKIEDDRRAAARRPIRTP